MGKIKKLVTDVHENGTYERRVKRDIGFSETIAWVSTDWANPDIPNDEKYHNEYSVIMPDGSRMRLQFGALRSLIIDSLDNDWECEGIWINDDLMEAKDLVSHKNWNKYVWYCREDWNDYDMWKFSYQVYSGDKAPIYFARDELSVMPDLSEINEEDYYRNSSGIQDVPCPYEYSNKKEDK